MASWREQRAEKERVEKEREEAQASAKANKMAGLSTATSSAPSTVRYAQSALYMLKNLLYLAIPLDWSSKTAVSSLFSR